MVEKLKNNTYTAITLLCIFDIIINTLNKLEDKGKYYRHYYLFYNFINHNISEKKNKKSIYYTINYRITY